MTTNEKKIIKICKRLN